MKYLKTITALFAALSMMFVMGVSQATTLTFEKLSNNSKDVDLSPQLFVDVDAVYTGQDITGATFSVRNEVGTDYGSISEIYFDYSATTNFQSIVIETQSWGTGGDVDFCDNLIDGNNDCATPSGNAKDVSPGELPSSTFSSEYAADSVGNPVSGVDHADDVLIFLAVLGDWSYGEMIDALSTGAFRIGFHIQGIDGINDESDSYASVSTVPVPAAAWLFGTALFGFFAASRRKKIS